MFIFVIEEKQGNTFVNERSYSTNNAKRRDDGWSIR